MDNNISLEQLYFKHKSEIYTLCMRLTMSKSFADDLFSDTWTRVTEKYSQLDPEQNAHNWIYTICLNIYRKQKLKRSFIQLFSERIDYQDFMANYIDPDEEGVGKEEMTQLQSALSKLSDKYRLPIILFYFRDLSYENISGIMNLPMSTVKYRLNQAKKLLKVEIEKEYGKK